MHDDNYQTLQKRIFKLLIHNVGGTEYIGIVNIFIGMEWRLRNNGNKIFETTDDGITSNDVKNDLFKPVWLSGNRNT